MCMRFEVLTTLKISVVLLRVAMPCGLVGGCRRFGGTYRLNLLLCTSSKLVTTYKSTRCHNRDDHNGFIWLRIGTIGGFL
jgi:hypothetical protein